MDRQVRKSMYGSTFVNNTAFIAKGGRPEWKVPHMLQ